MTDEKNPTERAVELLLFAPVGLALSAKELLPQLVERGRQQVSGQVTMARLLGQFAVKQGQVEAEKAFGRARTQAQEALEQLGVLDAGNGSTPVATTPTPDAPTQTFAPAEPTPEQPPAPSPAVVVDDVAPPLTATRPGALAIPDYDSLSASQVLPRLSGLTEAELEAVRAHEAANRRRKTILSKVAQLTSA